MTFIQIKYNRVSSISAEEPPSAVTLLSAELVRSSFVSCGALGVLLVKVCLDLNLGLWMGTYRGRLGSAVQTWLEAKRLNAGGAEKGETEVICNAGYDFRR